MVGYTLISSNKKVNTKECSKVSVAIISHHSNMFKNQISLSVHFTYKNKKYDEHTHY